MVSPEKIEGTYQSAFNVLSLGDHPLLAPSVRRFCHFLLRKTHIEYADRKVKLTNPRTQRNLDEFFCDTYNRYLQVDSVTQRMPWCFSAFLIYAANRKMESIGFYRAASMAFPAVEVLRAIPADFIRSTITGYPNCAEWSLTMLLVNALYFGKDSMATVVPYQDIDKHNWHFRIVARRAKDDWAVATIDQHVQPFDPYRRNISSNFTEQALRAMAWLVGKDGRMGSA